MTKKTFLVAGISIICMAIGCHWVNCRSKKVAHTPAEEPNKVTEETT